MYKSVREILDENGKADYTVSITSGTPTMHACWIFLQQGGVIQAKLIQVQRETGISEVNFNLDDFPEIKQVDRVKAELTKLSRENRLLKSRDLAYDNIIGECPEILQIKDQIKLFADSDISVFIHGESGTGKELVAEALHYNSSRKEKPFIKVNCGAISPE
ncbi:MAG: sigma 54-interacting transcriptional regulator, partial [Candidatus Marinimicrobia bacterium]|nr:sigma 54-interacting transcriptional regulator [Candidatus Neomarinimicrobiota bacterium]